MLAVDAAPALVKVFNALQVFALASDPAPKVFALAVTAPAPLKVVPDDAPEFELSSVSAFVVVPPLPLIVLHPNPVPLVHVSALDAPEQEGKLRPLGVVAVNAPRTEFAVREGSAV